MNKLSNTQCPVAYGLEIFGDRWTLLVLRDLIFRGKTKFSEFTRSSEHIASNILTDRLSRLETAGLVEKRRPSSGGHPSYHLTQAGAGIIPVLLEIIAFSADHGAYSDGGRGILHGVAPDVLARFQSDRDALLRELRDAALS